MPVRVTKNSACKRPNGARKTKDAGNRGRHGGIRIGPIPSVDEIEQFNLFFRNLVMEVRRIRKDTGEHENRLNGLVVDETTAAVTFDDGGV